MTGYLTHFKLKKAKTPYIDVVPPQSKEEAERVKESIEQDGVDEPIVVDSEGNILDGHFRQSCEPDCPFRIKADLKTDAEKRAYAFRQNMDRRQFTKAAQEKARKGMKETALALWKEGRTQDQVGTMLGIPRSTIRDWCQPITSNGGPAIACKPGHPAKVAPEQAAAIPALLAAGNTQTTVAASLGVTQQAVSQIAQQAAGTARSRKMPKTISGRALAARAEIAAGKDQVKTAARYHFTKNDYERASRVAKSGRQLIIDAMDQKLILFGKAVRWLALTDDDVQKEIIRIRFAIAKKNEKPISARGRKGWELLLELLSRTWVDWRGFGIPINSQIIPANPEKFADVRRLSREVRNAVNSRLDQIEKEIERCLPKMNGKKTS